MSQQSSFQVYNASAGSGKTFTLVREYLKILLLSESPYTFQNILAITFTNKAAAEMKERVLKSLTEISLKKENDHLKEIVKKASLKEEALQKRAQRILFAVLQNYSAFNINTIDTFTHKLIRAFAMDLGISVNFDIEMDTDPWYQEAVDQVVSQIGIDKDITSILIDYALQQADDDRSWDVSKDLKGITSVFGREDDAPYLEKLQKRSVSEFYEFRKALNQRQKEIEKAFDEIGKTGLELIEEAGLDHGDFLSKDLPNFFKKLIRYKYQNAKTLNFTGRLKKNIDKNALYKKGTSAHISSVIDGIADKLISLYTSAEELYENLNHRYKLNSLLLKNLTPLAVLSELNKTLKTIKKENNIRFISEFNRIINKHLAEQPAAFIYERIGEKFRHYFIDEMQDTSVLQWQNLIPLISNVLAGENSGLMLVGDAKQSIYRWRGGNPEQFICLATGKDTVNDTCSEKAINPFTISKDVLDLEKNYRSFSEVIHFNNLFFTSVAGYFIKENHKLLYEKGNQQKTNNKKGGYVNIELIEGKLNDEQRSDIIPEKVARIIQNLDGKLDRNEICILVRKRNQGIQIADYLSKAGIQIESSETLLLKNDQRVDFMINMLQYLSENENKEAKFRLLYFLHKHLSIPGGKHRFISELLDKEGQDFFKALEVYDIFYSVSAITFTPLYESLEEIIRSFRLNIGSNAYVRLFLEEVFKFSRTRSQSILEFLEYWELKKDQLSITTSDNKDAVKISTIHKSKGLEYRIVIFPFDLKMYEVNKNTKAWYDLRSGETSYDFDEFFISATAQIKETGKQGEAIYQKHQEELELDNFNLLYVSFTRAVEQLYILAEADTPGDMKNSSHFIKNFLKDSNLLEEGKQVYEFGSFEPERIPGKDESDVISVQQEDFISSAWQDHQINIVTSASVMRDDYTEEARLHGNLIHEIMAQVYQFDDLKNVVAQYVEKGILQKPEADLIYHDLEKLINHHQLSEYFKKGNRALTERELLSPDHQILIPDRLNFFPEKKVVIMDYKTGNPEREHHDQINTYADVLNEMGYDVLKKLLVYTGKDVTIAEI